MVMIEEWDDYVEKYLVDIKIENDLFTYDDAEQIWIASWTGAIAYLKSKRLLKE